MAPQREQSATESGVARRTVRNGCSASRKALEFGLGRMDVVRHHGGAAREAEALIHGQIVLRPGERLCYLVDFEAILIEVSLHTQAFVFSHQSLADFEH